MKAPLRRDVIRLGLAGLVAGGTPWPGRALAQQPYPSKPVTLVVPFAAGGASDIVARLLAEALRGQSGGQAFVVDNRPGAGGWIGVESVIRAAPDGYTVLVGNTSTNSILPLVMQKRAKPDFRTALTPVGRIADVPAVLVTTTRNFTPANLDQLVAYARANPGKLSYATAGLGSLAHLSFLAFANHYDIELVHVPYKGGAVSTTDTVSGDVQLNFLNVATAAPLIKEDKLRPIAVAGSQRLAQFPDVPTLAERGVGGSMSGNWQGLFLPASTPAPVAARLTELLDGAMRSPALLANFKAQGIPPAPSNTPEAFARFIDTEFAQFKAVVDKNRIDFE